MQAPTTNPVTQTQHGQYKAVDYSASPDIFIYAPEDGTISGINPNNGDCGRSFNLVGATGRHGFCHTEEYYVKDGQKVVRGQKLAKMGYTGLTVPKGPGGRHLHWILNRNGTWFYPPNLVNESFIKQEGEEPMPNDGDIINLKRVETGVPNYQPSGEELRFYKDPANGWKKLAYDLAAGAQVQIDLAKKASGGDAVEKIKQIKEIVK